MRNTLKSLDFWGGTSSLLCAIHCALLPILISVGLLQTQTWLSHPFFEITMILLTIFFVYNSLFKGYYRGQVNKKTFYTALFGLILVAIHHFTGNYSSIIIATGGLTIAFAHFLNLFSLQKEK